MKKTRLRKFVSKHGYMFLIHLYKEAKKTHDIETILAFKSFVTRMIEAQELPQSESGVKIWTDVDTYIDTVLSSKTHLNYFNYNNALDYIVGSTRNIGPFDYKRERDFRRTL